MSEGDLRFAVVEYLGKEGYLTRGFVGDGPVRMGFAEAVEERGDTVVGLKVIRNDPFLECEVVAVKILEESSSNNFSPATEFAQKVAANRCVVAAPFVFDADDKEIAGQMGVGLLEIHGKTVKEVIPSKLMASRFTNLPRHKFEGLSLVQELLEISESNWGHLARVFCRADEAYCGFYVGGVQVELTKNVFMLNVDVSVRIGLFRKWSCYSFKFGEIAGFIVDGNDDRYTFVEKLGRMFVFGSSDWNFMLNLLSKTAVCRLSFYIGTAKIVFSKPPDKPKLRLEVEFIDGSRHRRIYSRRELAKLTEKKKTEIRSSKVDVK